MSKHDAFDEFLGNLLGKNDEPEVRPLEDIQETKVKKLFDGEAQKLLERTMGQITADEQQKLIAITSGVYSGDLSIAIVSALLKAAGFQELQEDMSEEEQEDYINAVVKDSEDRLIEVNQIIFIALSMAYLAGKSRSL